MTNHGQIRNPELKAILKAEGLRQIAFMPLAADDDWFKTSTAPTGGVNQTTTVTSFTKDYCPGWPVVPVVVVTDNAGGDITAVSVVIKGYDQFGDWYQETVAGTNNAGTWTATATRALQKVISVAITLTGTADANDRYIIGFNKTYGFGVAIGATADVIAKLFNGSADAGTVSAAYSTYVVAGTPDAAKELVLCVRPSYYLG